ncbi:UNVERIFIED_CONTAM: Retrovirus-related Pol polyprotein from transposon TNT 1-94 [Sesamum angustifolium]|uniref:Retrovirus-related Pol polyprotein from transposon TNT 1-94 n=1 Tax=Sesamum angustifolium TaxID=2727405 RepID=A0AAW2RK85_9LAMI
MTRTLPDLSKMEPLDGTNFNVGPEAAHFFFEQLEVDYVLSQIHQKLHSDDGYIYCNYHHLSDGQFQKEDELKAKYEKDNRTVRGHLLNYMTNTLFDLFVNHKSARTIWNTLESRYGGDDAGRKNTSLGNGCSSKSWMKPPQNKKRDLTLQELISHMRTEEANRLKDKEISNSSFSIKANLVEPSDSSKDRFQRKDRTQSLSVLPTKGPTEDQSKAESQLNLAETEEIIAAVVVEANLVENKVDWILDTGASKHFCANKELFHEFHEASDGECVFMGNSATAGVMGKGKVLLKLTSGKILALLDVLYVPSLRRNLISGSLLNKVGLKIVLESDKVIITRNGDFIGKGYLSDGLFVLNTVSTISNKNSLNSAYLVESINIWHGRLGHVNYASIKRLKHMNIINTLDASECAKCSVCVEAKFVKKPFKPITHKSTTLLELIHSDLADFKNTLSKGGKKYYISFVDDYSRYTKIYLLRSKDEASEMFLKYKAEVENQLDKKIKRLRSDRGGEYSTNFLKEFCENNGIIHETSAPYTPQQNGVAKGKIEP